MTPARPRIRHDREIRWQAMKVLQMFGWRSPRIARAFGITPQRVLMILKGGNKRHELASTSEISVEADS